MEYKVGDRVVITKSFPHWHVAEGDIGTVRSVQGYIFVYDLPNRSQGLAIGPKDIRLLEETPESKKMKEEINNFNF